MRFWKSVWLGALLVGIACAYWIYPFRWQRTSITANDAPPVSRPDAVLLDVIPILNPPLVSVDLAALADDELVFGVVMGDEPRAYQRAAFADLPSHVVHDKQRNTELFLEHLDDLRRSLRGYTKIHVICDNAAFHLSRAVRQYLARWRDRIQLHYLPKYAPETNPIERVWWHFHETITRNHRCRSLAELLDQAYDWFQHAGRHYFEMRKVFPLAA